MPDPSCPARSRRRRKRRRRGRAPCEWPSRHWTRRGRRREGKAGPARNPPGWPSRRHCRCRREGWRPSAASRRGGDGRRCCGSARPRRGRPGPRTPIALMTRRAQRFLIMPHPVGGFVAMQLQPVGTHILDDLVETAVGYVDGQRDDLRPPAGAGGERGRPFEREIARARRKKDEADHVGAGGDRRIERLLGRQPADLHDQLHASDLA